MAHIVHIEPDKLLARAYGDTLIHAGHSVAHCVSGQEAISAIDERRPDIILLELQLVMHNGLEFLYELRSYPDWQGIPVIVLTSVPKSDFARSLDTGYLSIKDYLYKPHTTLKELCACVDAQVVRV